MTITIDLQHNGSNFDVEISYGLNGIVGEKMDRQAVYNAVQCAIDDLIEGQ